MGIEEEVRITGAGYTLGGRLIVTGERAAVVAPPHPLMGGRMDNPVVEALALGLGDAGVGSLRFDFRGVGRSEGRASGDAANADADYAAALDALSQRVEGPLSAAGYSFGAAAALRAAASGAKVERLLLVALPAAAASDELLERAGVPITLLVGDDDSFCPLARARAWADAHDHLALHVIDDCDHFFGGAASGELRRLAAAAMG